MNKKVSILILTYNGEKYLKEAIDSCLNQTYKNTEVCIIDDCSTDGTIDILKSYGDKIKVIYNKINQGIAANFKKLGLAVKSDFIVFIGQDDKLSPQHVEMMLGEFDDDTVIVYCNSIIIDGDGKELGLARDDNTQIKKTENSMFELSLDNFINAIGIMHRTSTFQKVLQGWEPEYKHYGEWLCYIRELEFGNIKYTTKTRSFYRRHETNITNTFKNKDVKRSLDKYKRACRNLAHNINKNTISDNIRYYFNEFKLFIRSFK